MAAASSIVASLTMLGALACATGGGKDGQPVDAAPRDGTPAVDAATDAPGPAIDARPIDAAMPDAGSGLFCSTNAMCTVSGECCVTLGGSMGFCAPGTIVLNQCVPQ